MDWQQFTKIFASSRLCVFALISSVVVLMGHIQFLLRKKSNVETMAWLRMGEKIEGLGSKIAS